MKYTSLTDFQSVIESTKLIKFTNCFISHETDLIFEDLWMKNGKIQDSEHLFYVERVSPDIILDCNRAIISPGFIDIQINGGFGYDFSNISQEIETSLTIVSKNLIKYGVTGFCPTLVASKKEVYNVILSKKISLPAENSQFLGYHIEGPFISELKRGMHKHEFIKNDFGSDPIKTVSDIYGNDLTNVKYVTLAPELAGSCQIIKYLIGRGVSVSLGHSAANFDEGVAAIECGANMLTHLFCSMNPFHHRDPHLVGLLTYDSIIPGSSCLYYGIITDLVHTHPTAIRIAHRANKNGLIVVTDANPAFGLKDGIYKFSTQDIEVIKDKSFVKDTGILAGGTTPLDQCMRNYWMAAGTNRVEALNAVTCHPADALKLGHRKGRLKPGYDADFVMLDYESMVVMNTWIGGQIVYLNPESNLSVIDHSN